MDGETDLLIQREKREVSARGRRLGSRVLRGLGTAACIAAMVASWVAMAKLLQDVTRTYDKPFFLSYFIHAHYSIFYVGWKLWKVFPGNLACNRVGEGTFTNFKFLAIATGILITLTNLSTAFWYLSLSQTSISANTAVYQSASGIIFIMSIPVLRERVSLMKVMSVAITIAGVALISVFSEDKTPAPSNHTLPSILEEEETVAPTKAPERNTPLGYVYLVLSVVFYSMMEVGYKKFATREDDPAPIQNSIRGLGYMGVHTLFFMWPLLVIFHFTGLETFEFPHLEIFENLLINVYLELVFNTGLYVCIALSSPLFATVGSVLVVPASVVVDWLVHHYILPWPAILGIISILFGFFFLVVSEAVQAFYWHRTKDSSDFDTTEQSGELLVSIAQAKTSRGKKRRRCLYYII